MNPDLSQKVLIKIESICEQGCTQVNQLIENANNGNASEELSEFTATEIDQIINELNKIMSIYDSDNK